MKGCYRNDIKPGEKVRRRTTRKENRISFLLHNLHFFSVSPCLLGRETQIGTFWLGKLILLWHTLIQRTRGGHDLSTMQRSAEKLSRTKGSETEAFLEARGTLSYDWSFQFHVVVVTWHFSIDSFDQRRPFIRLPTGQSLRQHVSEQSHLQPFDLSPSLAPCLPPACSAEASSN